MKLNLQTNEFNSLKSSFSFYFSQSNCVNFVNYTSLEIDSYLTLNLSSDSIFYRKGQILSWKSFPGKIRKRRNRKLRKRKLTPEWLCLESRYKQFSWIIITKPGMFGGKKLEIKRCRVFFSGCSTWYLAIQPKMAYWLLVTLEMMSFLSTDARG